MLTEQNFLEFRKGYIDALLWATYANPEENGYSFDYFNEVASDFEDFTVDAQSCIDKDCKDFLEVALSFMPECDFDQAGHDFLMSRNRHGSGFWDRIEFYGEKNAHALDKLADSFGEIYLYWEPESETVGIE